jgi:cytochrome P450
MANRLETKEKKKIPSLSVLPLGGFLFKNLATIQERFPDIVRLRLGLTDAYLVIDPHLVQEVLVTKQRDYMKGKFLQRSKKVFGEGLLTSEDDTHHKQRRLVQPAFHKTRIDSYAKIMTHFATKLMTEWRDLEIIDAHSEMNRLTMSIVAKCLFDADVTIESKSIGKDLTLTIEYFNRLASPLAALFQKLPNNKKYKEAVFRIDEMIYNLIETRRKSGGDTGDLMSMLLHAKDENGKGMPDKQLRDEVLILFTAGHETTANALTWTWYLISENPTVEKKFHEEVDSISEIPGVQDIKRLEYTARVFTESMRLYPPAWVLVREALKDSEIGDYLIPKGSNLVVSQYVNHHDPRFFPDPEKFDPERWSNQQQNTLPKFAYFPFGGGPRSCVGEPFAWMEGVLLLATIAKQWSLHHIPGHKVEMLPRITLRPRYGMKMQLSKR